MSKGKRERAPVKRTSVRRLGAFAGVAALLIAALLVYTHLQRGPAALPATPAVQTAAPGSHGSAGSAGPAGSGAPPASGSHPTTTTTLPTSGAKRDPFSPS